MASYARSWERFEQYGLQLVGISVDELEQNRAMVEKLLLPFRLLSDPDSRVIREWDVLNPRDANIARPSLFLVLPDMSIAFQYVGEDFTDRPSDDELFAAVERIGRSD